jgi:sugar phosphate permease
MSHWCSSSVGNSGSGVPEVGFASSAFGIAMIVAPILLRGRVTADRFFAAGLGMSGLGLLTTGLSPVVWLAIVCYAIAGVGNGLENVACDTLLGRSVAPELLGRIFGAVYGPIFLAETLSAVAGGLLLSVLRPSIVFLIAGAGLLVLAAVVRRVLPREQHEPVTGVASAGPEDY